MSKADTQKMLLEAGIDASKVSVLDNGEMVKTEAKGFWSTVFKVAWAMAFGWASGTEAH